jgi:hypothetical protein
MQAPFTDESQLVSKRDAFLIRIDPKVLDALRRWADDDLRSVNAQIEFLLRRSLRESGRAVGDSNKMNAAQGAEASREG